MKTKLLLLTAGLGLAAALPASAAPNYALSFDGVDDYVETATAVIPTNGDFTVSCWARVANLPASGGIEMLSQGSAGNAFYLGAYGGQLRLGDGAQVTGLRFPTGAWHHFTVVKSSDDTICYLDGTPVLSLGAAIPNPAATPFRLGRQYGQYTEYFPGQMGDVRVWRRALSAAEVEASRTTRLNVLDPGLVAGWRFEELVGVTCTSAGVPPVVGTLFNGPQWRVLPEAFHDLNNRVTAAYQQSGPGWALGFNGGDNWVDTGLAAIPASGDFTVECWAKGPPLPEGESAAMVSQGEAGNAFYIGHRNGELRLGDGWQVTGLPFPAGDWHHYAVVKTSGETRLYLDGTNVLNRGYAIPNPAAWTPLRLGRQYGGYGENWAGHLDEVRVWRRALSEAEIRTGMYYAPEAGSPGLEAYWPFSEGRAGGRSADASGQGHTLDLHAWPLSGRNPGVGWAPAVNWSGGDPLYHECHQPFGVPAAGWAGSVAIAAGVTHSLAQKADRTVVGWGENRFGETRGERAGTNVVAIAAGLWHSLALKADGTVVGWGYNVYGQADGWRAGSNVVGIAAGDAHSLALKADGTVVVWGDNGNGQTDGWRAGSGVVAIASGERHCLALKANGSVVGWGWNYEGQADGWRAGNDIIAIAAGDEHSLALRADGTVVGWGWNGHGQAEGWRAGSNIVAIAAGGGHSLALRADGTVVGWGWNSAGQAEAWRAGGNVVAIAAGYEHSLALKADGAVVAWGSNEDGRRDIPASVRVSIPVVTHGEVNADTPGVYSLTAGCSQGFGETIIGARTVVVHDTIPPLVTLNGTDPVFLAAGVSWPDPGATASDACAGDLTASVVRSGTLDLGTPGTYTLGYRATDPSGNVGLTTRRAQVGTVPDLGGLDAAYESSETMFGTCTAELRVAVNPNGLPTTVRFEYARSMGPTNASSVQVPARFTATNLVLRAQWLSAGAAYRWRVVATNLAGITTSPEQVLDLPPVPSLSGISGRCYTNDPLTGTLLARLNATVNPNGQPTTVTFQQGRTTNYVASPRFDLPASATATNLAVAWSYLIPNYQYHWRVVASNAFGVVASPDYLLVAQIMNVGGPTSPIGDFDGDGTVDKSEVEAVLFSYLAAGTTLTMTNVAGLGQSRVVFTVPELPGVTLRTLVSTNLEDWENLGPAVPSYEFTDTNAPAGPQRFYRLRWP